MKTSKKIPLPHKKQLRADASWVLYQVLEEGRSTRDLMPLVFERHSVGDKAWLQEMIFGCLRVLPSLQVWLRQHLSKPLKGEQKIVEHLIMLGFYQLHYSRIAEHAAISETVEACVNLKLHRLKGLVNANLRSFQRDDTGNTAIDDAQINSGLAKWLYKQLQQQYPERIDEISDEMNKRPPLWLRVNTLKCSAEDYAKRLDAQGIEYQQEIASSAILLNKGADVSALPGYQEGLFSVQDRAAQHAASLLMPQAGEHILDCCCAPGGKTAHILETMPDLHSLIALDNSDKRLLRVAENMQRLGHDQHFDQRLQLVCEDATVYSWQQASLSQAFDRILLDAPCSATGVIRRHPDIRWHRKLKDIEVLVDLQAQLLEQQWQNLRPGGTLLYATCSVLQQENQDQIKRFLSLHTDAQLVPINAHDTPEQPGWQIFPGEQQMDGFYYARLIKSAQVSGN